MACLWGFVEFFDFLLVVVVLVGWDFFPKKHNKPGNKGMVVVEGKHTIVCAYSVLQITYFLTAY